MAHGRIQHHLKCPLITICFHCVQSCQRAQIHCVTIHRSRWPVKLFVLLDYMPTRNAQRDPLLARVCRGLEGVCCRQQPVNSWWSGPLRGQQSPSLKPLVWRWVSSLAPCWLHKAKVLCDCLQALLFCFVCLPLVFFYSLWDCRGFWGWTWVGIWR